MKHLHNVQLAQELSGQLLESSCEMPLLSGNRSERCAQERCGLSLPQGKAGLVLGRGSSALLNRQTGAWLHADSQGEAWVFKGSYYQNRHKQEV